MDGFEEQLDDQWDGRMIGGTFGCSDEQELVDQWNEQLLAGINGCSEGQADRCLVGGTGRRT